MNLSIEQYEALIALARTGANTPSRIVELDQWLRLIETQNGIIRDFVLVQWQELSGQLPPSTRFPTSWPPQLRHSIELLTRPICRADVDAVLAKYASEPLSVLVTRDPAGIVGWTAVDDFFK